MLCNGFKVGKILNISILNTQSFYKHIKRLMRYYLYFFELNLKHGRFFTNVGRYFNQKTHYIYLTSW